MEIDPAGVAAALPPAIYVAPDKFTEGANNLAEVYESEAWLTKTDLKKALEADWPTDAHFYIYTVEDELGAIESPRLNKAALGHVEAGDLSVWVNCLVIDFDLPGKRCWENREEIDYEKWKIEDSAEKCTLSAPIADWTVFYTTKHGYRLVYVLEDPIDAKASNYLSKGLIQLFLNAAIEVDTSCWQWTRCYRLPFVLRDGERTADEAFVDYEARWKVRLDVDRVPPVSKNSAADTPASLQPSKPKAAIEELEVDKPSFDEAVALMAASQEGLSQKKKKLAPTHPGAWLKATKKALSGRECYGCLFDFVPMASEGARNDTLLRYVGQAVALLHGYAELPLSSITPAHIYALFLPAVDSLEQDESGTRWDDTLWRFIKHAWQEQEAEHQYALKEAETKRLDALQALDTIREGRLEFDPADELKGSRETYSEYILSRLIVVHNRTCYLMQHNGYYTNQSVLKENLIPAIKQLGMQNLIPVQVPKATGGFRTPTPTEIINEYGYLVHEVRAAPQIGGGVLRTAGGAQDKREILFIESYARKRDMVPLYSRDVDHWLKAMFGPNYEEACNWIGHALAFEEGPTCGLSLRGAPGSGKGMIVAGLAECITSETFATKHDMTSGYPAGLRKSGLLWCDEGMPQGKIGGAHPADTFREWSGGGQRVVDVKHKEPISLFNPVRFIFTANEKDLIQFLTSGRDIGRDTRAAIAVRLLHFEIGGGAATWLAKKGGREFTSGWVAGDTTTSNYVVARHFMWLYHNKRLPRGSRFLVHGNGDQVLLNEMQTYSGSAPLVIETLIGMCKNSIGLIAEKTSKKLAVGAIHVAAEDRALPVIYLRAADVLEHYRTRLRKETGQNLSMRAMKKVLEGISLVDPFSWNRPNTRQGAVQYYAVSAYKLLNVAKGEGRYSEAMIRKIEEALIYAEELGPDQYHIAPEFRVKL